MAEHKVKTFMGERKQSNQKTTGYVKSEEETVPSNWVVPTISDQVSLIFCQDSV